jgi:hypothetical protein
MYWDEYRADYDSLTFAQKQLHATWAFKEFPEQEHHSPEWVKRLLAIAVENNASTVAEIGGWRGELAQKMFDEFDLDWTNYDYCAPAIRNSVFSHEKYHPIVLDRELWEFDHIPGDIFVAAHVIEHLKERDLRALMSKVDARWVYFEAPLLGPGQTWDGYQGDHILEVGWDDVHALMRECGFELIEFNLWKQDFDLGVAYYRRLEVRDA